MTTVAHGYIAVAQEVVNRIASEPIKNHLMRLRIMKAKKAMAAVQESWDEVKNEMLREYGTETEGGVQIDPEQDNFTEFRDKYEALSSQEVTLTVDAFPDMLLNMFDLSSDDIEILLLVGLVKDGDDEATSQPDSVEPA